MVMPYQDNFISLISTDEFRDIVDDSMLRRIDFIRKAGNAAVHGERRITKEQAALCLENLFIFLGFLAYCYADNYEEHIQEHRIKRSPDCQHVGIHR